MAEDEIMTDLDESEYEYEDDEYDYSDVEDDGEGDYSSNTRVMNDDHVTSSRSDSSETREFPSSATSSSALEIAAWTVNPPKISILFSQAIQKEMEMLQRDAAEALGLGDDPFEASFALLRTHQWDLQSLLTDYFSNPETVLKNAGVFYRYQTTVTNEERVVAGGDSKLCPICYDTFDDENSLFAMPCGHKFCLDCWSDFLENAIQYEGASCVLATCPDATCHEVVTVAEVKAVAAATSSEAGTSTLTPHPLVEKFRKFQLQSFVESNPLLRWCPAPGCEHIAKANTRQVLEQSSDDGDGNDQTAKLAPCCKPFCFCCGQDEPHHPVSCRKLVAWNEKNANESETANWMTANTKPCPKCSARINKDGGCMYMTCQKCRHSFCWVCNGTHHVTQCNAYQEKEEDSDVTRAKNELERYLHYYGRYHGHDKAQTFCQEQLNKMNIEEMEQEEAEQDNSTVPVDLAFLKTANEQLLECRRVLKYSYVFAYYRFVGATRDSTGVLKRQKECFEHHQGILEGLTEGLSKTAEVELAKIDQQDVINRTRVIGQFIKNVLEYIENGMLLE